MGSWQVSYFQKKNHGEQNSILFLVANPDKRDKSLHEKIFKGTKSKKIILIRQIVHKIETIRFEIGVYVLSDLVSSLKS
jgi:hypothetical protein